MADVDDAYDRGHMAGEINARLAGHDQHFASINGSLADIAQEMHRVMLAVQRLGDEAIARDATALATAFALKEAEEARRVKAESAWTPIGKMIAALGAVAAIATVVGLYLALVHH